MTSSEIGADTDNVFFASASGYRAYSCVRPNVVNLTQYQYFVLDADVPRGPKSEFCRVIGPAHVTGLSYSAGAKLFKYESRHNKTGGGST